MTTTSNQVIDTARKVPFWGYMAVPLALGIVCAMLFTGSSISALFFLIVILLAFGRAVVWSLRVMSFLLTAFFVVFIILVVVANILAAAH